MLLSCISKLGRTVLRSVEQQQFRAVHLTASNEAARKGTREKARKNKKAKVEVKKVGFIPYNQRNKDKLNLLRKEKHVTDSWKRLPCDNVYIGRIYRYVPYTFADAIECHRETHHPTMYGLPNSSLNIEIELNMQGEKITRFVDNFHRTVLIPNKFDHGDERNILVLAKGEDNLRLAADAGAALAGGPDTIKNIQNGDIKLTDYHFVIAHPNIMPELVSLRGLMKRKFPNPKNGTLGMNLAEMVEQYKNGIQYSGVKDEYQQNYCIIKTCIGTLNMETKHLEENLRALLIDVNQMRPRREGKFITRVTLKSPPSSEIIRIDAYAYVSEKNEKLSKKSTTNDDDDDDNDDDVESNEVESVQEPKVAVKN